MSKSIDRLRKELGHPWDVKGERLHVLVDEAEAEDERLRSLVRDMWRGYGSYTPESYCDEIAGRIAALGIEVDA